MPTEEYQHIGQRLFSFTTKRTRMKVYVNDESVDITDASNIAQLLKQIKTAPKGIAVAIGPNIIPSNLWDDYLLKEDDQVLLIRATQGG